MAKEETGAKAQNGNNNRFDANQQAENIVNKTIENVSKNVDNISNFARDNFEAFVKSTSTAAKHAETVFAEIVAFSKKNLEDSVAAAKEISSVRTPDSLAGLQSRYAQQAFENYLSQSTRLSDLFVNAGKEVAEPLNARLNAWNELVANKKVA